MEEPQLNGRIATVINKLTHSAGWQAREELLGALRGPKTKPDILITRADGPPIVLETEYPPATTVADDCMKSIGRELNPLVANASGRISSVIAIRATDELHQCLTGSDAQRMLEDGHEIEYAVYQGNDKQPTRFPQSGFIKGNMRDLVDFIRPASEPQETINAAIQSFETGVEDVASLIRGCAINTDIGQRIGTTLRQQWPAYPAKPPATSAEEKQEKADQNAREQTSKMTATMIINALAYQQNLAGFSAEVEVDGHKETRTIKSITQVRQPAGDLHPDDVITEWKNILSINYWPIFHIAMQLLLLIPPTTATRLLEEAAKTANAIQEAIKLNDVSGTVFQKLIADRQTLATYYTRPESTVLAAHLAIPDDLDWADPETLKNYRIADYACGSGGLVLAAYHRARDLHRNHGGNPDAVHGFMMENSLTACDIMPAAVHLTASLLSSVAPRERFTGTRSVLYPFGGTGQFDKKGKPIVDIGSLELLDLKHHTYQAVLPLNEQMALGATKERKPIEVDMVPLSQSLVIMNPPFTTPTNHAADHAKPGNPAFAAFNTTQAEQRAMSEKTKRLAKQTVGDGYAGLGSNFAAIANNMAKPNGHVVLILPLSAMVGGSYDGIMLRSWQKLRSLLAEKYNDIIVLSIAQEADRDASFSADTDLAEIIVIARSLKPKERPRRKACFVNLYQRPIDKLTAQETAKAMKKAIALLSKEEPFTTVKIGDNPVATVLLEDISPLQKWTSVRVLNLDLLLTAKQLGEGRLRLPQRPRPVTIPVTPMRNLGSVGPVHRLFTNAFDRESGANDGTEWPMLWNRENEHQLQMAAQPDCSGSIKNGEDDTAYSLWQQVSNLH